MLATEEIESEKEFEEALYDAWNSSIELPPNLTVTEWCEENIVLSERVTEQPGPFRIHRAPYGRAILDAFGDPFVEFITLCAAAQVSKTTLAMLMLAYAIAHDPGPVLWVMPTETLARAFSKARLQPMIRDCPMLAEQMPANKDDFSLLEMQMKRMTISLVGSNSPANLASRPIRYLFLDEVDKFPGVTEKEAGAIDLAEKRTRTYGRSKIIKMSTPTIGTGEIWQSLFNGNCQHLMVPCPHCSRRQRLTMTQVKWPIEHRSASGKWDLAAVRRDAYYECKHCKLKIRDYHKQRMMEQGIWRPSNEGEAGHHSWHLPGFCSLSSKMGFGKIAVDFLKSKNKPEKLRDFVNSTLAQPWEERGESASEDAILAHSADYSAGTVPAVVNRIIMAVDVQRPGFYYTVRAWAHDETSWLLRYGYSDTWEQIGSIAEADYLGPEGEVFRATHVFVDSGDGLKTKEIYEECGKRSWQPTKGDNSQLQAQFYRMSSPEEGVRLLIFKTEAYKDLLQNKLAIKLADPGAWHLHKDTRADYAHHLTGEERVIEKNKYGREVKRWKRTHDNHWLDCEILQLVGNHVTVAEDSPPTRAKPKPQQEKRGKDWIPTPSYQESLGGRS